VEQFTAGLLLLLSGVPVPTKDSWRDRPITPAQERVLQRWARISGDKYRAMPATRGEASDIISSVVEAAKKRDEADEFDPPNDIDPPWRDWGDL
jgi:hypothetical protein